MFDGGAPGGAGPEFDDRRKRAFVPTGLAWGDVWFAYDGELGIRRRLGFGGHDPQWGVDAILSIRGPRGPRLGCADVLARGHPRVPPTGVDLELRFVNVTRLGPHLVDVLVHLVGLGVGCRLQLRLAFGLWLGFGNLPKFGSELVCVLVFRLPLVGPIEPGLPLVG